MTTRQNYRSEIIEYNILCCTNVYIEIELNIEESTIGGLINQPNNLWMQYRNIKLVIDKTLIVQKVLFDN